MPGLDAVFARLANDASFADSVRSDPTRALLGYTLSPADLRRVAAALGDEPFRLEQLLGSDTERLSPPARRRGHRAT